MDVGTLSLASNVGLFLISGLIVALAGTKLATTADILADRTGLGEAIFGALLLGGSTSLSGIVTSVTAAADGYPNLAVSNATGSIAAQTAFLALADMFHRRVNLEHAAASVGILMQGTLLITLLAIPLLATTGPTVTLFGTHPASFLLFGAYIFGLQLISKALSSPMWKPRFTAETVPDLPRSHAEDTTLLGLWMRFVCLAAFVGGAGYLVAETGIAISIKSGLSETVVGGMLTAIATSLAEAVTTIAAVRMGALTLGVSNIIGGNCFDVTVIALADFAYPGSIYSALVKSQVFLMSLTLLLTGILLMGLLVREKHGLGNIGLESWLILIMYVFAFSWLFMSQ